MRRVVTISLSPQGGVYTRALKSHYPGQSPGLGNLGNTRSKLSLKCATTLDIGRLANRGSYPKTASRFWAIEIRLLADLMALVCGV